jgi:DedD protein
MLLDSEPTPVSKNIAIRIPDRNAAFQPNLSEPAPEATSSGSLTAASPVESAATPAVTSVGTQAAAQAPAPAAIAPPPAAKPEPKVEPKTVAKPDTKPKADTKAEQAKAEQAKGAAAKSSRSDDGARALALLEGRPAYEPSAAPGGASNSGKPMTKGNFVVQAASLDAAADAQSQKEKLSVSGVSNAFVDGPVQVNGMQKYRVRVGPFPSREAAQAAQTRLRTLGFGGAFITSQ